MGDRAVGRWRAGTHGRLGRWPQRAGTSWRAEEGPESAGVEDLKQQVTINLKEAKHAAEIVREVCTERLGWRETSSMAEDCAANAWFERAITVAEVKLLNERQLANMIPGMHDIAKKTSLAKALNRWRLYADDFGRPRTGRCPRGRRLRQHCRSAAGVAASPSGGCQGNGIT